MDVLAASTGVLVLLATAIYFLFPHRPKNFPPGPIGLPFVGYLPFLGKNPAETYMDLKEKYGSVFSVPLGREHWIILNDYDTIHEALVKKSDIYSGRRGLLKSRPDEVGILARDHGPVWKALKKFSLMSFRKFGVDKGTMEDVIVEETSYLIDNLLQQDSRSLKAKTDLAVSNIICGVTFGSRFEYNDPRFLTLSELARKFFANSLRTKLVGLIFLSPTLRFLPFFRSALAESDKEYETILSILRDIIEEHKRKFNGEERDIIDSFLKEMNNKGENDPTFNNHVFVRYLNDLLQAGTETSSNTLCWSILCLAHHRKCLDRLTAEIDLALGPNGQVRMADREKRMPYMCAFLEEVTRHRTPVPLGVLRKTNGVSMLNGYRIPDGSTVLTNLWSVHHDPNLYQNPEEFKPERFLSEDGEFVPPNHVIPFSIGVRSCLGERLARMELFLFLTGILQKLRIVKDPTKPIPAFEDGSFNVVTYSPPAFSITFEAR